MVGVHLDRGMFVVKRVTVDNKHEREVAATLHRGTVERNALGRVRKQRAAAWKNVKVFTLFLQCLIPL